MMRSLVRAIGALLRATRRAAKAMVRVTVWICNCLVSILVPAPLPPMDELEPEDDVAPVNDNAPVSDNQALRDLAYAQLQGRMPTAQQLGAVSALQADWLASMDAEMCHRLLRASDAEIRSHLLGSRCIRGLLWCDAASIGDYATALEIDIARREGDVGLDEPLRPKMPA